MKRLNTNAVTSDIGLVLQHKHLDFIQDKTEESLIHSIYSQLGGVNTGVVILYGCIPTFTTTTTLNDTLTITAGAISYQGKIYEVSASTQVKTGSAVHLLKIYAPSYDASDPSLFTDGVSRNVQEIRVAALSVGATGSGISDWSNILFYDTGWIDVSSYGIGVTSGDVKCRRSGGRVFFRGHVNISNIGTWGSSGGQIVFLPTGLRPLGGYAPVIHNIQIDTTASTTSAIFNLVLNTGEVRGGDYSNPTHEATIFLDGISFYIE